MTIPDTMVVTFFSVGVGQPVRCGSMILHLVSADSWEDEAAGEHRVLTSVMAGDDSVIGAITLLKASSVQPLPTHLCCSGETLGLGLLDRTMAACRCRLMSTHASILVDSVGPPSAEVCRTAASFP
jgi:hypothetical protein